jgi:oxygen-dependent protoporphyrinogen oxidase
MNTHYQTIIIGGGLSGLTVAHKLRGQDCLILEKNGHSGGVIKTHSDRGFIAEIGPHGFLDNCKESRQILEETGLDKECLKAPLIDFVRYVYLGGKLNLIPQTPIKILMAPLIPWSAKLRVLGELWKPPLAGQPSVAKWANYRFGPALLPYLDAVYTGTYAGDFDRLTIDSVMPGARALEREYGSLLRGLIARYIKTKKNGSKGSTFSMPAMTSFSGGMQRLVEKLAEPMVNGRDILHNTTATSVRPSSAGWQIETTSGTFTASNLVFSLPINSSLKLLGPIFPDLPLKSVPETWISTVVFGFSNEFSLPPGFGYLTPEQEQRFTLGSLFSSNMFAGRAPEGHILFETLVGGRRHPERLELDDSTLIEKSLADVREILKIKGNPVYTKVLRPTGSIPQLERNYPELLSYKEKICRQNKGLHICGFGWEGIGLNDMMKSGTKVASEILSNRRTSEQAEVKGVYF